MDRNQAKRLLPIIKAFAEGKAIQLKTIDKGWQDIHSASFDSNPKNYRIKPEPKYRPFKDAEECWNEMQKHQPFGWIKDPSSFSYIIQLEEEMIGYGRVSGTILHDNFKDALRCFTFADGTPFGVKVEEQL